MIPLPVNPSTERRHGVPRVIRARRRAVPAESRWGVRMLTTYGAAYLACLLIFVAIDVVWLSVMVRRFYRPRIGELLRERRGQAGAAVFYLLSPVGVVARAVGPGFVSVLWTAALARGALLGALCY